ncbi:MAG: hypothetical protein VYC82_00430, partial [Verrucomicrobiota bacterium]|nr:hypothetical protein [Verrucomicrobiota bacterium]
MSFSLSSRAKRVGIALTLVIMLPALAGCVYLRLLHFKNQLKSFDENVSVLKGKELAFEFSKPIVKNSDFVFLTGSQPSRIDFADSADYNEWWTWHFQKRTSIDSDRPFRMTFQAHFRDDLLTRFEVDQAFVDLFGQDFTEEILSRMGHARINKLRRSVTMAIDSASLAKLSPPSLKKIVNLMGAPTEILDSNSTSLESCRYEFRFYNPKSGKTAGRFSLY